VYHNPSCGKSRGALDILRERGVACDVVEYLQAPPDRATYERFLALLAGPPADLVRKDKRFKELGLDPNDYTMREQVVTLLLAHPELHANRIDTGFLERHLAELCAPQTSDGEAADRVETTLGARLDPNDPLAVLAFPSRLLCNAWTPSAVFWLPVIFDRSAKRPVAVLSCPVVFLKSASTPVAVLNWPLVLCKRALKPAAVLLLPTLL